MNRLNPQPDQPRRPAPRYGEGLALVEPAEGLGADFIRGGGERCPCCNQVVTIDDLVILGHTATATAVCDCGFRAELTFRLIDAEV